MIHEIKNFQQVSKKSVKGWKIFHFEYLTSKYILLDESFVN